MQINANYRPGAALGTWHVLIALILPKGVDSIVVFILKVRKTKVREVKGASRTQTLNHGTNNLSGYCGGPEVRKQVLFQDHELKVWQISSAS